jgi:DNA gyrase subunit A
VAEDISVEDLIAPQDMVVTFSHGGYVKGQPLTEYKAQRRGGRGKSATTMKEDDFIERLFVAHSHDYLLCFSNRGRLYWLKVYEVPAAAARRAASRSSTCSRSRRTRRSPRSVPVKEFDENHYVFMATAKGTVKKTALDEFSRPRPSGIIAVGLEEGDYLVGAGAHRRQVRRDAVLLGRQERALRGGRRAPDGPARRPGCAACASRRSSAWSACSRQRTSPARCSPRPRRATASAR